MDTNSNKLENDDYKNMYEMKKNTYWEKYGVKRFYYRGRRKYTPLVYQSEDGGMIISNDVFGLTIRQFERTYNSCLDRRKTHEQWILNLRYPNKSSNEYLEYLQNCTDCGKEHLFLDENDFKQTDLVRHLIKTIGIEIDIRNRQRLFIIQDMIDDVDISKLKQILSGSLAEGLNLPSSDLDIMFVIKDIDVIENLRNIKHTLQRTTFVMETDTVHPGFARLSLLPRRQGESGLNKSIRNNRYLSVKEFLNLISNQYRAYNFVQHGPCISDKNQNFDFAFCLRSKYLPNIAVAWSWRYRQQWPPTYVIDKIKNNGCLLVPIGPKNVSNCNCLWRLSFSVAEKHLVHSFNFTQLLCYGLLKLTLKHIVNTNDHVKDLLCSYFLKTALFWVSEGVDIDTFKLPKLFFLFFSLPK